MKRREGLRTFVVMMTMMVVPEAALGEEVVRLIGFVLPGQVRLQLDWIVVRERVL